MPRRGTRSSIAQVRPRRASFALNRRALIAALVLLFGLWYGVASAAAATVFTDDPLPAGTPIKAVHIAELRSIINMLRLPLGLSGFVFTDPNLRARW
jgi:hypothetical protein